METKKKRMSLSQRRRSVALAPTGVDKYTFPPRFPLLDKDFYVRWCRHRREVLTAGPMVSASAPPLYPELYLKPRRLNEYAHRFQENINVNKEMLKNINIIQKTGGFVDCWRKRSEYHHTIHKRLCKPRQDRLNEIHKQNMDLFERIQNARSQQLRTKELEEEWQHTKRKLILGATFPFILFKHEKIDKNIRDPAFDKPQNVYRVTVVMDVWVEQGAKIGRVMIELFTDIVPQTCDMFMTLVKGDNDGKAYTGTRFFTIVPGLYCRGGDMDKDNGFGSYMLEGDSEFPTAENYLLKHTVPGVLSMVVSSDNEVYGQFNIIFKPLPQFDGKHVVFGRIVSGPPQFLERISALGLPLGTTSATCRITKCGYITRGGHYHEGNPHTSLPKKDRRGISFH